jgi:thymidylate synthase ThyX
MPPEQLAYALARYSRSSDSIVDSIEWVRTRDSKKFLESFYFQYGHASIADLGHLALCWEGVSELAATEIEDEPLWDGQAKSSRYQDFGNLGFVTPPEFRAEEAEAYRRGGEALMEAYRTIHAAMTGYLKQELPRPADMKADAYERNIAARAFDVARYTLFWGVPTNAGQVTSIRTLERQIRRLRASEYSEVRALAGTALESIRTEHAAPTLAKYAGTDEHLAASRNDLRQWAIENMPPSTGSANGPVDLIRPAHTPADIVATLLYPVTDRPFRELYELASGWSPAMRGEVLDVALQSKSRREELLREFRGGLYAFDMVMDIGAYRDMHRHRRCHQFRQAYTGALGYATPSAIAAAGLSDVYQKAMDGAWAAFRQLPEPGSHYLLPFAANGRFLFKMDFAEADYICRLRSGVKGHFSYRQVAWDMKIAMEALEPELGRLIEATPPWIEDPLVR